jgi:hypothetical protein
MKEISTIAVWVIMSLSVVGLVVVLNRLTMWVKQIYWFITDEDDLCEYPEISDVS